MQISPEVQVAPVVVSGADLGFRIEARRGSTPVGTLVVRVNGQWVEANWAGRPQTLDIAMTVLRHFSSVLVAGALIWSAWSGWRIWTTPVRYGAIQWQTDSSGRAVVRQGMEFRSFREVSLLGPVPLLIPVGLAGVALWAAWRRRSAVLAASALLFALFTFLAGFSIGGAYIVPGAAMIVAMVAGLADRARPG